MKIRGVVFDFNGTLFWDTPQHNAAWFVFCDRYHIPMDSETLFRLYHGRPNSYIVPHILHREEMGEEELRRISDEKELLYQDICRQQGMQLAPGAERLLSRLAEQGIPFTIATASERLNVDFYYEQFQLQRWFPFEKIVYCDGSLPGKPDPTMYLLAMEKIGVRPAETMIFEDSFSGIQAAIYAQAGRIIVVDSNGDDYSRWSFPVIHSFDEVESSFFFSTP